MAQAISHYMLTALKGSQFYFLFLSPQISKNTGDLEGPHGEEAVRNLPKVCFVVCDNGFSQIFYNCSNVEEIFSLYNIASSLLQNMQQKFWKSVDK